MADEPRATCRRSVKPRPVPAQNADPRNPSPERQVAFEPASRRRAARPCSSSPRAIASWRGAGRRPVGEIDIVARRRHALVFVEVKAREHIDDAAGGGDRRASARIARRRRGVARSPSRRCPTATSASTHAGCARQDAAPYHQRVRRQRAAECIVRAPWRQPAIYCVQKSHFDADEMRRVRAFGDR